VCVSTTFLRFMPTIFEADLHQLPLDIGNLICYIIGTDNRTTYKDSIECMKNQKFELSLDDITAVHTSMGPLYHSLGHMIRGHIISGEWQFGQKIPSEREMMQMFNVSRATVRQGIGNLVKEGVLYRIQGKGTFVSPPKIEHGILRLMDFQGLVKQTGLKSSSELLNKALIAPNAHLKKILKLAEDENVISLQRLLFINQSPTLIETSYFSFKRFPDLLEKYTGEEDPQHYINTHYGVKVARVKEIFEPVILEDKEASILGTQGGFPALWVETNVFEEHGQQIAYFSALLRGDRCRTFIELTYDKP
jgi:GntR family transcriptional regulator